MPNDFTVEHNQTAEVQDIVNTTIQYKCSREFWVFDVKNVYKNCDYEPEICEWEGYQLLHSFDKVYEFEHIFICSVRARILSR